MPLTVKTHITRLLQAMNEGVFEKEHVIALSLLSAIAGESIFLLGPPGVAKSLVARRLKLAFSEGSAFEYLMSRFSTPDEIFGPVSISKLKDEDKYERIVDGYLPSATVVFLDEIWKAGPSIQNSLLTVINEKIYRNGQFTVRLPLKGLIAASNELPARGEGLEALWDRFLMRYLVGCIEQEYAFDQMIASVTPEEPVVPDELRIGNSQYEAWRNEIGQVKIHYTFFELVHHLKRQIEQYNAAGEEGASPIYVSDRRWKKIVALLRASAFLNGADTIRFSDCTLLLHCLWDEVSQMPVIEQMVYTALNHSIGSFLSGGQLLEQKLNTLKENMKAEHSLRELKDPALRVVDTFYYQIDGFPIAGNPLIFASDYQNLKKDSNKLFYVQQDKYRRVNQIFKVYDPTKNRNIPQSNIYSFRRGTRSVFVNNREFPLLCNPGSFDDVLPEETELPFEFRFREVIDLYHQTEAEVKRLIDRETDYYKQHLFMDSKQQQMMRRLMAARQSQLDAFHNEIRETAYTHGLENKEY